MGSLTTVTVSTGKWFVGWFATFGVLYTMAEINELQDLAATLAISVMIGSLFFITPTTGQKAS